MLAFLPMVGLILIVLALWTAQDGEEAAQQDVRDALARGLLVWGVCVAVLTEALGAMRLLRPGWIAAGWSLVILVAALLAGLRMRRTGGMSRKMPVPALPRLRGIDWMLLAAILVALGLMLVVAIASPPQEGDALAYHMGRVAHWAQNRSVAPYATPDARQLWAQPWTEFAVLHLYVLAGSDHWVNLVGWMCLAFSAVLATRIAGMAGARPTGQLLSGLFVATLPIAVPQASSVLTDVPTGLWVLVTAWVVLSSATANLSSRRWFWLGAALGLGELTKGSYVAYGVPLFAWFFVSTLRRAGPRVAIQRAIVIGAIAGALVLPQAWRNWQAFASPLGYPEAIASHGNARIGIRSLLSNSFRSGSLLLTVPSSHWNALVEKGVFWIHLHLLGLQTSDPANTLSGRVYGLGWSWPGTNSAPVHVLAAAVAVGLLIAAARRKDVRWALGLAASAVAGFLIFGAILAWQGAARFHVPFMMLLGPVAGAGLGRLTRPGWSFLAGAAMLAAAVPAILAMPHRPLLPVPPYSQGTSVFQTSRDLLFFGDDAELLDAYRQTAAQIGADGCTQVGLFADSSDQEYLWWVVLAPAEHGIRIEHLNLNPYLEKYIDPAFSPCAVICTVCSEDTGEVRGLPLRMARDGILLYSRP